MSASTQFVEKIETDSMKVAILVEIPEALHEKFLGFLESQKDWDQDCVMTAALSLFLLQNKAGGERATAKHYLDALFKRPVESL